MAKKRQDHVAGVLKDFEMLTKSLRADVRRAARQSGLSTRLDRAASVLRSRAIAVAAQVEKYAHEVRLELAQPTRKPVRRAARRAA